MTNGHPNMREFSMFFHATLSVLGVIALLMMNLIIDKMDGFAVQQQAITITLAKFMIATDKDIKILSKNQDAFDRTQHNQLIIIDRAKRHFEKIDRKTH